MRTRTAGKATAGALAGLVIVGVFVQQFGADRSEIEAVREGLDAAKMRLSQVNAAEKRRDSLDSELAAQARDLEKLALILPPDFDTTAIVKRLNEVAGRYGAEVQENGYREKIDEIPHKGEISITVFGPPSAVELFTDRIHHLARLQGWQRDESFEGGVLGTVTTWYWPEESRPAREACRVSPRRRVWLPPFRAALARSRQELETLCSELDRKRHVLERIERYEFDKERISELVDTINRLKTAIDSDWPPKEKAETKRKEPEK
jgi:hypothetical protein